MINDFLEKEFDVYTYGEVNRKMDEFNDNIVRVLVVIFNLIPAAIYLLIIGLKVSYIGIPILIIWYIWFYYCYRQIGDLEPTYGNFIFLFPTFLPSIIIYNIIRWYLVKRYPNTNDPEEIKKFYRAKKIKTIL